MEQVIFGAETRKFIGTGAARAVRRSGLLPAVVYSAINESTTKKIKGGCKNIEGIKKTKKDLHSLNDQSTCSLLSTSVVALPISLNYKEFNKLYQKGGIKSKVVVLDFADGTQFVGKIGKIKTVVREIQFHPVTDNILHVDLQEVDESSSSIHMSVNVHILNTDKCIGIKRKGGNLNLIKRTIDVTCKTSDMVSFIEIDIANLDVGHSIHISDIIFPLGIEPIDKPNSVVLTISAHTTDDGKATTETEETIPTVHDSTETIKH